MDVATGDRDGVEPSEDGNDCVAVATAETTVQGEEGCEVEGCEAEAKTQEPSAALFDAGITALATIMTPGFITDKAPLTPVCISLFKVLGVCCVGARALYPISVQSGSNFTAETVGFGNVRAPRGLPRFLFSVGAEYLAMAE